MKLFDSHCHLQLEQFDEDREDVYRRALDTGVDQMTIIGIDANSSLASIDFCEDHEGCYPTAGLHPHEADFIYEQSPILRDLLRRPDTVAVGETGLDFYKEFSPRTQQEESLATHLNWAIEFQKPLVFHCRDSDDTLIQILEDNLLSLEDAFPDRSPGVVHCFSGTTDHLLAYQEMGFFVSFSGILTFPDSEELREAAAKSDPELTLIETDSPFLAPRAHRGKRNEPAHVVETAQLLATILEMEPEELAQQTTSNAEQMFLTNGK